MELHRAGPLAVLVAAVAMGAGCYRYVPVSPRTPEPGSVVRMDVSDQAATQLTGVLGPGVLSLNGLVLAQEDQTISLLVSSYNTRRNAELSGSNDPVRLSVDQITHLEQKRLDKGRSFLLGAAFVGGAIAITTIFGKDDRVLEPDDPNDPGPIQRRRSIKAVPAIFRIRFP
jgi:hypothetical protein